MTRLPLISCIMPTVNRPAFVAQSIKLFQAQDYANKELIIVDETRDPTILDVQQQRNIRSITIAASTALTLGAKCNLACSLAQGEIIAHWDDDDYYAPQRLTYQVAPLLRGEGDIVGLELDIIFNVCDWTAWRATPALRKEISVSGVANGNTMMYRRKLWGMNAAHPNKTIGEDADFLRHLRLFGAKLVSVPNNGSFIYIRHGETWPLPPHYHPHMHEWQQVEVETILPEKELAFYSTLRNKEQNT